MKILSKLKRTSYKDQFFDSFYLFLLQGTNHIIPLIVIPYLMIVLGAENYGFIGLSTAFSQYFVLIIDFGFNFTATKRIAIAKESNDSELLNKTFFSTLYCKIILFVISIILLLFLGSVIPKFKPYFTSILCTLPLIIGSTFSFSYLFQGIGKIRIAAIISTISKFSILPFTFVFVRESADYNLAIIIQSSVHLVCAIISLIVICRYKILNFIRVRWADIKEAYKDSFPLFLSSVATSVYTQLFIIILAFFVSSKEIGCYSAAERIMRAFSFLLYRPITQAFYPKISALSFVDRDRAKVLLRKLGKIIFVIMASLCSFLFIFAPFITNLVGESYDGIDILLRVMSFAPIAIALGGVIGQMGLIALGNENSKRYFTLVYWIMAPLSLLLVFILTSLFKTVGAAFALIITEYLVFLFMFLFYKKTVL